MGNPVAHMWVLDDVTSLADITAGKGLLPQGHPLGEAHIQLTLVADPVRLRDELDLSGLRDTPMTLGLHLDFTGPQSPLGRQLIASEETFASTGDYIVAVAIELERMDVLGEARRQLLAFSDVFGSPTAVSVHHYLDAISPTVRDAVERATGEVSPTPRYRGRVEPIVCLLSGQTDAGATTALHVSGFPNAGAWPDAPPLPDLLDARQPIELVFHPTDDPAELETLWHRLEQLGD